MLGYLIQPIYKLKPGEEVLGGLSNYFRYSDNVSPGSKQRSRKTEYWAGRGYDNKWQEIQDNLPVQLRFDRDNPRVIQDFVVYFKLQGVEFGNWVNQEDRYNYISACATSLYTLNSILKFGKNIGLNQYVGLGIGSRGRGRALAHFEPGTGMINITRYKKGEKQMAIPGVFYSTGGVGSLAHEYGHALDYYFGLYHERQLTAGALSDDFSIADTPMRKQMDIIIDLILFEKGEKSNYYISLEKAFTAATLTYLLKRTELFARAFEVYISKKSSEKEMKNRFLVKPVKRYDRGLVYIKGKHANRVCAEIDKLVTQFRKAL